MTITERERADLDELYADFAAAGLMPLWTQREGLMPVSPRPAARPHRWRWADLLPLAERSAALVPVGRGGERRAIALANPGLPGQPYATPTLWAAIQYLGPREVAPAHRHTQGAFRFVVDGEGVWTNVDGDAVAMRRGDLLLTPGWAFHEHHNTMDRPMAWLDGLDIPLVAALDAGFFEFGPDTLATTATPDRSRGERLWGHPGLRPAALPGYGRPSGRTPAPPGSGQPPQASGEQPGAPGGQPPGAPDPRNSPLAAYRWAHTDAALAAQLELEAEGTVATLGPGHACVRFCNPASGGDALVTIRTEMHRLAAGTRTGPVRHVGSAVWQVFAGEATATVGDQRFVVAAGDLFAVPSWCEVTIEARDRTDLFRFSDEPVYEALGLARTQPARP